MSSKKSKESDEEGFSFGGSDKEGFFFGGSYSPPFHEQKQEPSKKKQKTKKLSKVESFERFELKELFDTAINEKEEGKRVVFTATRWKQLWKQVQELLQKNGIPVKDEMYYYIIFVAHFRETENYFDYIEHNQFSIHVELPNDLYEAMLQRMHPDHRLGIGSQMYRVEVSTLNSKFKTGTTLSLEYRGRVKTPHTLETLNNWLETIQTDGHEHMSVEQDNDSPLLGLKWLEADGSSTQISYCNSDLSISELIDGNKEE